jgi:hypothetical protein
MPHTKTACFCPFPNSILLGLLAVPLAGQGGRRFSWLRGTELVTLVRFGLQIHPRR